MDAINSVKTKECGKKGVENTQSAFGVIHNAVASINEGKNWFKDRRPYYKS